MISNGESPYSSLRKPLTYESWSEDPNWATIRLPPTLLWRPRAWKGFWGLRGNFNTRNSMGPYSTSAANNLNYKRSPGGKRQRVAKFHLIVLCMERLSNVARGIEISCAQQPSSWRKSSSCDSLVVLQSTALFAIEIASASNVMLGSSPAFSFAGFVCSPSCWQVVHFRKSILLMLAPSTTQISWDFLKQNGCNLKGAAFVPSLNP